MDKETGFYFIFGILIVAIIQLIVVMREDISDLKTDIALIKCVIGDTTKCL